MTQGFINLLACATGGVLSLIALLHAYWALGGYWPAANRDELSATVVGSPGTQMPSPFLTWVVALMILGTALVPMVWAGLLAVPINEWLVWLAMLGLAGVFLVRGAVTYTPLAERYGGVEPFASLNRRYYSPLCLVLGLSFVLLLYR